jgi:biotin synthase
MDDRVVRQAVWTTGRPSIWPTETLTRDEPLTQADALAVLEAPDDRLPAILAAATAVRRRHFGDRADLCSILNAKSGLCGEDCIFCAQSSLHHAQVDRYPLLTDERIEQAYGEAAELPIGRFGLVTSGKAVSEAELGRLCELIARRRGKLDWCASLGTLGEPQLRRLKAAGLKRFHHNLETAESYFPSICTTHTYADRVATVRAAQRAGLEVCCGGLFGLGEQPRHRVELAIALRELGVEAIPLNFLVPIAGTPAAAQARPLSPEEILKTVAMFRLVCPTAEIKVCAGRERHLGPREPDIFAAGATGMMIGGYLTVRGRSVAEDLDLLRRAGMQT